MLFEEHEATVIGFLGEFLVHTFIDCNHIPGRVELVAYQLDNHISF